MSTNDDADYSGSTAARATEDGKETKSSSAHGDDDATTQTATTTSWLREHAKEFMDEWTRGGLSRYVDLPMICVLGDTSSGKSSVLSNLIGLELPSASTLTTKCPVLIQLQRAESHHTEAQQAIIDIQWRLKSPVSEEATRDGTASPRERKRMIEQQREEFFNNKVETEESESAGDNDGKKEASAKNMTPSSSPSSKSTSVAPPPPPPKWEPRILTRNLESQVPACIQEAQETILKYRETLVAPDVICITLWSTECQEELTLVDLPGLVQYQHQHDISLLGQVEQVVLEYVHNSRSILVPVIAAPTNIHNSKVLQWCKHVDPSTRRTIPVMTKPDLIDPGSESNVVELLQQPKQQDAQPLQSKFHHGFYLVMNRGQALLDGGASLQMGLKMEQEYFATNVPWNAIAEPRLGIPALRSRLAAVLWQVMEDSMPNIWQELQEQRLDVQRQLKELGTLFHTHVDQRKFYHNLSQQLVSQVAGSLSGKGTLGRKITLSGDRSSSSRGTGRRSPSSPTQRSVESPHAAGAAKLHAACHEFFEEIQASSLATIDKLVEGAGVVVSTPGHAQEVRGELVHIAASGLHACVDFVDEKDHTTDVLFDGIDYVAEQPDFEEDEVWSEDGNRVFIGREGGRFDSLRKIPTSRIRTDPSWLQEKMSLFRTDDLACFINVHMFQHIVADFVQEDWVPPCFKLVDTLQDVLTEALNEALAKQLQSTKRFPLLEQMVESTCQRVAQQLMESVRIQVQEHLVMEQQHPYTQDEVLLQAMNQSRFKSLRRDLEMQLRLDQEGVVYDTQAIQAILDRVFAKHQRTNWMAEQMELVLSCYGQVATQRVLDRTPQMCWQTCRSLPKALQEELGCITDDVLETCLWESPVTRRKFHDLAEQLNDLQRAMDCIKSMR